MLGWEPRVELREGLSATIDYFRELEPEQRAHSTAPTDRERSTGTA